MGVKALRIPEGNEDKIEKLLKKEGFVRDDVEHSLWRYLKGGTSVTMYKTGALVVQGNEVNRWAEKILDLVEVPDGRVAGCDEAGKGDIFGSLVLCCAVIDPENFRRVLEVCPKDSKRMKDEEIRKKAKKLKELVSYRCINIPPERFNDLYKDFKNINRLLDSAYLKLIDFMRKEFAPKIIVVDKYSSRNPFQHLKEVEFMEKGEREVAVSVASIIARDKFLRSLEDLGNKYGVSLPKGASSEAKHLAKEIKKKDPDLIKKLAKEVFL